MEWFKHMTYSHDDPDISDAWDIFGDAGPVVFWTLLEIYGSEFSRLKDGNLTLSKKFFERKLRRKWITIERLLDYFQTRNRIIFSCQDKSTATIKIPKFLELSSNWTKRQKPLPTEAPTEAPTAKEVEVEVEVEKKEYRERKAQPPRLTDQEYFEMLKTNIAYQGINVETEKAKCEAWCLTNGRLLTRRTFVNWLNRVEKPLKLVNQNGRNLLP